MSWTWGSARSPNQLFQQLPLCPGYKASGEEGPHCSPRRAMKTVLLLLIVLAAAMGPAQALRCHVCNSATNCKQPQNCQASARYCRTLTRVEPLSGNLVEKDCVETCTPTNTRPGQVTSGTVTWCCQGDLCNERLHNAAPGRPLLASTALGLGLALGLLALTLAPSL